MDVIKQVEFVGDGRKMLVAKRHTLLPAHYRTGITNHMRATRTGNRSRARNLDLSLRVIGPCISLFCVFQVTQNNQVRDVRQRLPHTPARPPPGGFSSFEVDMVVRMLPLRERRAWEKDCVHQAACCDAESRAWSRRSRVSCAALLLLLLLAFGLVRI